MPITNTKSLEDHVVEEKPIPEEDKADYVSIYVTSDHKTKIPVSVSGFVKDAKGKMVQKNFSAEIIPNKVAKVHRVIADMLVSQLGDKASIVE